MTTLRYKDYQGSVTFEDGHLLIQVLHIDDFVTTECDSAAAAQSTFEELVDDYLETCAEVGKEPSKPFKGTFNVRVSPTLHKRAAMLGTEAGESLNAIVAKALESFIEAEEIRKSLTTASFAQSIVEVAASARVGQNTSWSQLFETGYIIEGEKTNFTSDLLLSAIPSQHRVSSRWTKRN